MNQKRHVLIARFGGRGAVLPRTGIGLASAPQIVHPDRDSVGIERQPDHGITFHISPPKQPQKLRP